MIISSITLPLATGSDALVPFSTLFAVFHMGFYLGILRRQQPGRISGASSSILLLWSRGFDYGFNRGLKLCLGYTTSTTTTARDVGMVTNRA
ncbi:hypothetical protein BDZ89DRAFT_1127030 [Hymenopellis radicata]|nr:hypothetical protein BDZ89DRAFT_1127030 [Hymenopellis radicata]